MLFLKESPEGVANQKNVITLFLHLTKCIARAFFLFHESCDHLGILQQNKLTHNSDC